MAEVDQMLVQLELGAFEKLCPRAYPLFTNVEKEVCRELIRSGQRLCATMLEVAISKVGGIRHDPTVGRDHDDGSDDKFATARFKSNGTEYSAAVGKFHNKRGLLRIYVYERIQDAEYFFLIKYEDYKRLSHIEIPFYVDTGDLKESKWASRRVSKFEELAAKDTNEVEMVTRPNPYLDSNALAGKRLVFQEKRAAFEALFSLSA